MRSLLWFFLWIFPLYAEITALYLTWYQDPTTTMAIQWHSIDSGDTLYLQKDQDTWTPIEGSHHQVRDILVHAVFLEHLQPDTLYSFRIGEDPTIYPFRTAPASLAHPLRFVIGGDAFHTTKLWRRMNQTIVSLDPLFCVIGGDIAYAIKRTPFQSDSSSFHRWLTFLAEWKTQMIAPDGRLIPFLLVPGNHDLASDQYELFFSLFAFPEKQLYRTMDFGSYLSLFLLDTNHFQPIEGRQTLWLDQTLASHRNIPYRFAIYHEAAYPSFYSYSGTIPKKIRTYWCPLFEKYHLPIAFEHHNHAFKRTVPIKGGAMDPTGVVYLGDGGWGAIPRRTQPHWYLAKGMRKNSVYLIDLTSTGAKIQALDLLGEPFDTISLGFFFRRSLYIGNSPFQDFNLCPIDHLEDNSLFLNAIDFPDNPHSSHAISFLDRAAHLFRRFTPFLFRAKEDEIEEYNGNTDHNQGLS